MKKRLVSLTVLYRSWIITVLTDYNSKLRTPVKGVALKIRNIFKEIETQVSFEGILLCELFALKLL